MYDFQAPLDRETFQDRLARARRDVQMAYGDFAVCWREAETVRDLEDVQGAISDSLSVMSDAHDQCRIHIESMKAGRDR